MVQFNVGKLVQFVIISVVIFAIGSFLIDRNFDVGIQPLFIIVGILLTVFLVSRLVEGSFDVTRKLGILQLIIIIIGILFVFFFAPDLLTGDIQLSLIEFQSLVGLDQFIGGGI